jgi:hypothetical protein
MVRQNVHVALFVFMFIDKFSKKKIIFIAWTIAMDWIWLPDTGQEHILTNVTFRQCGYRPSLYSQYDSSPTRGCGDNTDTIKGCNDQSTVFGFLTHSDQFNPEVMQGTKQVVYQNCGRRFKLHDWRGASAPSSTVSGRTQNWLDVDGTASGTNEPTLIGSGQSDAGLWWKVEPSGNNHCLYQYLMLTEH